MPTLKRKKADGTFEFVQMTGIDVANLRKDVDETSAQLAQITPLSPTGDNDTTLINSAIHNLSLNGGGIVQLSEGTFNYTQIRLKRGVYLQGKGEGTVLKVMNGTTDNTIILDNDEVAYTGLFNLVIEGNKNNSTAPNIVYLSRPTIASGSPFDTHFRMANVKILNGFGNGLTNGDNMREGRYNELVIANCGGIGLNNLKGATDNYFYGGVCFANIDGGVKEGASNNKWVSWKCFGNGDINNRSAGFYINPLRLGMFTLCESQENYGHGFVVENTDNISFVSCVSSSNGITTNDQNTPSDLMYNGFEIINSRKINISGKIFDFRREARGAQTQNIGVNVDSLSSELIIDVHSSYQQKDVEIPSYSFYKSIYVAVNGVSHTPTFIHNMQGDNNLQFMTGAPNESPKTRFTFGERKSDNSIRLTVNDLSGNYVGVPLTIGLNGNMSIGALNSAVKFGNSPTQKLGFFTSDGISQPTLASNATDLATAITLINDIKSKLIAYGLAK